MIGSFRGWNKLVCAIYRWWIDVLAMAQSAGYFLKIPDHNCVSCGEYVLKRMGFDDDHRQIHISEEDRERWGAVLNNALEKMAENERRRRVLNSRAEAVASIFLVVVVVVIVACVVLLIFP